MITTEEIAIRVYQILQENLDKLKLTADSICYERNDYTTDGIVIVPKDCDGEGSVRNGMVFVNCHVPDLVRGSKKLQTYEANRQRLIELRKSAIECLSSHYEPDSRYSWKVTLLNPPVKEQGQNEHFNSFALEITIRRN